MLNTLSARTTFYDIIGYFVPGTLAVGVVALWVNVLGGNNVLMLIANKMLNHCVWASVVSVAICYVAGHCANSCSSWLLEKIIFAERFADASNWLKRLNGSSKGREDVVQKIVDAEFGVEPQELKPFDLLVRMEEFLPQATISGFSFLCFYGMSRTVALLSWFAAIPVGLFIGMHWSGCCYAMVCAGVVTGVVMCVVGALFANQYLRFVRYYYDFLASSLMFPVGKAKSA